MTPDRRSDSSSEQSAETTADAEPKQRNTPVEPLDEPLLPDSYRVHHGPVAPPAPTQHKTIETETVKVRSDEEEAQERDAELRRRVTIRSRRRLPGQGAPSSNAPVILKEEDREAFEDQLVLRRATAKSRHWLMLGGSAALLVVLVLVLLLRSTSSSDAPSERRVAVAPTPAEPAPPAPIPAPTAAEPQPQPEAVAKAEPTPAAEPTPVAAAPTRPKTAAAKPAAAPAAKPAEEAKPAAKATAEPPKAAFPPAGGTADIRRDVPF